MTPIHSVLYVEDDFPSRTIGQMLLSGRMQIPHVTIFPDSQDFEARLDRVHPAPEIILLDIHMDPIDGFEMLQLVRQNTKFKDALVVALTASVMNAEVDQIREAGFDSLIAKPIDLERFPKVLTAIAEGETVWAVLK